MTNLILWDKEKKKKRSLLRNVKLHCGQEQTVKGFHKKPEGSEAKSLTLLTYAKMWSAKRSLSKVAYLWPPKSALILIHMPTWEFYQLLHLFSLYFPKHTWVLSILVLPLWFVFLAVFINISIRKYRPYLYSSLLLSFLLLIGL